MCVLLCAQEYSAKDESGCLPGAGLRRKVLFTSLVTFFFLVSESFVDKMIAQSNKSTLTAFFLPLSHTHKQSPMRARARKPAFTHRRTVPALARRGKVARRRTTGACHAPLGSSYHFSATHLPYRQKKRRKTKVKGKSEKGC